MVSFQDVSAIFQNNFPPKLEGLGYFTIPCNIGDQTFLHALMDFDCSINVMAYAIFEELKLDNFKRTSISLQSADQSIKYPRGIINDVLAKVHELLFQADFVVMVMKRLSLG